jgi:hypothetical protein
MYKSETITRPDGTKYVQCSYIEEYPSGWSDEQESMARAIKMHGTSA